MNEDKKRSYYFKQKMIIKKPLSEVFNFFSDARNLQEITPPQLDFKILTDVPLTMKENAIINFRIKIFGLPFNWKSKITNWTPPRAFTDKQQKGPYRQWIHNHIFEETEHGVLMTDEVFYNLSPFIPRSWVNKLFVRPQITKIFQYRYKMLNKIFHETT